MAHVIDQGSPADIRALRLDSRKRQHIHNEQQPQLPLATMLAFKRSVETQLPSAICRSLNPTYNCMGMVFAARRTAIDPERFQMIVDDDGYRRIPDVSELKAGDVAVYRNSRTLEVIHVGVVIAHEPNILKAEFETTVLSQFGSNGEYFHPLDQIPTNLSLLAERRVQIELWTDRS